MKKIVLMMAAILLTGCSALAEESIEKPLCPSDLMSKGLCVNNPKSPCCDLGDD